MYEQACVCKWRVIFSILFGKNYFLFDVKVARVWLRVEGRMWNCLMLIVIVKRRPAQLYHWIFVKQALKMPDSIINLAIWTKRPCSIVLRTLIKNTKHPLHPFENVMWGVGVAFEIARRKSLSFCLAFFFFLSRGEIDIKGEGAMILQNDEKWCLWIRDIILKMMLLSRGADDILL